MPRKPSPPTRPPPDPRDARIRELTNQLYFARRTVLGLVPVEFQDALGAWFYCRTRKDLQDWERWVIENVMAAAQLCWLSPDLRYLPNRALCPLCRGGTNTVHGDADGFAFPIGLSRHLGGTHGVRRCEAFAAAYDQAFESTDPRSSEPRLQLAPDGQRPTLPWLKPTKPAPDNVVRLRPGTGTPS